MTKAQQVQRILSQISTSYLQLSQERKNAHPLRHPTPSQWTLLKKLKAAETKTPDADRTVYQRQRAKVSKSREGLNTRKALVKQAIREIDEAKLAERNFIMDERRRKVGGGSPYSAKAKRRRKRTSARDVVVWLAWKRRGKFGICAIRETIRSLKKSNVRTFFGKS